MYGDRYSKRTFTRDRRRIGGRSHTEGSLGSISIIRPLELPGRIQARINDTIKRDVNWVWLGDTSYIVEYAYLEGSNTCPKCSIHQDRCAGNSMIG